MFVTPHCTALLKMHPLAPTVSQKVDAALKGSSY